MNVVFGVAGSIAAVKVAKLAHELRRRDASIHAVVTDTTTGTIHPRAVEFATDDDAVVETTGRVEHVNLCDRDGWVDVFLVVPVTANMVGKMAAVIDDSPVTATVTTVLGTGVLVVVTPAMHESMYNHPGILNTVERVQSQDVGSVDPRIEEGRTKIAAEKVIATGVAKATTDQALAGTSVVVTADATTEPIDPIRIPSDRASGRMGHAVARTPTVRGTNVTLVHNGNDAHYADVLTVESAAEILDTVEAAVDADADALVPAAAISDFIVEAADQRIRSGEARTLDLEPAPKLIETVRRSYPGLPIVGLRTETTNDGETMVGEIRRIMDRVDLAFVVASDASVMDDSGTRALAVRADETSEYVGLKGGLDARVAAELATELEE